MMMMMNKVNYDKIETVTKALVPRHRQWERPGGWQNVLEAGRANLGAVCSNAELPGAFFRQQWGRPELAATSLTLKRNWRWPLCAAFTALFRADLSSLFSNVIGLLNFIIFKLQTIHPNPGPHLKRQIGQRSKI